MILVAFLVGFGCATASTPDIQATVATAVPISMPTPVPDIDETVEAGPQTPISGIPTATALPTATHTPVPTVTLLTPTIAPLPTPTDSPAASPPTSTPTATPTPTSTHSPAPTPIPTLFPAPNSQPQRQTPVFYERNGLTLEYYWPLDDLGNLSADETEILAYNESDEAIEFKSPNMSFEENGSPRSQTSGTWEKFPSRYSWDRIEYISIPPSAYRGDALLVHPGEKAKIHWHLERVASKDTDQSVALDLTIKTGEITEIITQTLVRNVEQSTSNVATAPDPTQEPQESQQSTSDSDHSETQNSVSGVRWSFNRTTWSPNGTPPDCSEPFVVQTPVDINMVTSALWPGQVRGAYVAHGGFRFDANDNNMVTVRAPIGSHLVQASRYLEGDDEQYLLFFSVPCGFFYRFDHVRVVSSKLAESLKDIPPPTSGDSRTTFINPPLWIEQGEIVGTSIGIFPGNIFVDFGLYDVRAPNNVTPNPIWADLYDADKEFGHYGVCFFDYLPGNHGDIMRSLPTGREGTTSDYCK